MGKGGNAYALRFVSGKREGAEYFLKMGDQVIIGRSANLDSPLAEKMVSRQHAKITATGGTITIEDLGSTNGTFVNGERVKQATLKAGDHIRIGATTMELVSLGANLTENDDQQVPEPLAEVASARTPSVADTLSEAPRAEGTSAASSPIIVLAPPRSFSSVFSAMLGQHPETYGLPELHLFVGDTVRDLFVLYKVAGPRRQDGLLRAIAELFMNKQNAKTVHLAKQWLMTHLDTTTAEVFGKIIQKGAPRRVVEKSVTTVWRPNNLQRLGQNFPNAHFIHLTRHPRAQGESMIEVVETDRAIRKEVLDYSVAPPVVDPQVLWYKIHRNISDFLTTVPAQRQLRVRGEDVLLDPDAEMGKIAEWLGLRTDAEAIERMKHPEASPFSKLGPRNAPFGSDPKFIKEPVLRPARVKDQSLSGPLAWREDGQGFADNVKELAESFGYH